MVVGVAFTVALGVLALNDYRIARAFFLIAGADAVGGIVMWSLKSDRPISQQAVIVFMATGIVGVLTLLAFRYVDKKQRIAQTEISSPAPAASPSGIVPLTNDQLKTLIDQLTKNDKKTVGGIDGDSLNSDLRLTFYGKDRLWFAYQNPTKRAANKPQYSFGLMDLTNPYKYATANQSLGPQPFPIPARTLSEDYVRAGESGGDEVLGQFMSHVKLGDVIYGAAWITCINCKKRRGYYLYWKVGEGGWYAEVPLNGMELPAPTDRPYTDLEIQEYVDRVVPREKRKPIKQQFTPLS